MNEKQQKCFDLFLQGKNIFLTGMAGSGKSFLIEKMRNEKDNIVVTATTGCAAYLLGAKTLHSWAGIGLGTGTVEELVKRARKNLRGWLKIETLIIDEISMISPDYFEILNEVAKRIRSDDEPFGGIQLILVGDFCQLPAIDTKKLLFETKSFEECKFECIYLDKIYRQSDQQFQNLLNNIRLGQPSEDDIQLLKSKIITTRKGLKKMPLIFSINRDVNEINEYELNKLLKKGFTLREYQAYTISNKKHSEELTAKLLEKFDKKAIYDKNLKLCENSLVMCLANLDFDKGIVNGSIGIVTGFSDYPIVDFNGTKMIMKPHAWEVEKGIRRFQIPLKLCWATTCHKVQGMSLDSAIVDCGGNVFEYGQSYVALSRVRSLDGLYLVDFDPKQIKINPKVAEFYRKLIKSL
jgi:ATP-dependent DNA helicase PIF1